MSREAVGLRCPRCGAPLEITPESILVVCKQCGYPVWTQQAYMHPIVVVPAHVESSSKFFRLWIERDDDIRPIRDKVRLKSFEVVYVPIYFTRVHAESRYYARTTVTLTRVKVYTDSRGNVRTKTETRTVNISVSGFHEKDYEIDIVARRSVDVRLVKPLIDYYKESKGKEGIKEVPIAEVEWSKIRGEVLASEITPQDAMSYARDQACDTLYKEVEKKIKDQARNKAAAEYPGWVPSIVTVNYSKIPCNAENKFLSPITLLPLVINVYSYEGKIYKVAFAGWDGRKILSEEPIKPTSRIAMYLGSLFSAGLLGGGGVAAAYIASQGGGAGTLALGAISFLLGLGGSYFLAKESLKDVRIEEEVV